MKAIYFDMDGTIVDLYGVEGWLEQLRAEDPTPYKVAQPLCEMRHLNEACKALQGLGIVIGVISWLSKGSSRSYDSKVRYAKKQWLKRHFPAATEHHFIKYGTPKQNFAIDDSILVDDNSEVLNSWDGPTIDATCEDIVDSIIRLINSLRDMV